MTKEEIEKRVAEVKQEMFTLEMCDHWTREDYDDKARLCAELRKLEKELLEVTR